MKKIFARSRGLLVIIALAMIAAMCTVSTAYASSAIGAGGASIAAPHGPAVSAAPAPPTAQCTFNPAQTCQSTDPTVALDIYYYGNTAGCTFTWDVFWGDGNSSQNLVVMGPPDGYRVLTQHTYATPGTYTILITGEATADCTAKAGTHTFTLLPSLPSQSPNWAGWVAAGAGPYDTVAATWTMPANKGTVRHQALTAFWVGFDGDTLSSGNIEQCGTRLLENQEGLIGYDAFYEVGLQQGAIKEAPIAVHPGDTITAFAFDHGSGFDCVLTVQHHGVTNTWSTGLIKGSFPLKSAEVITEAPGYQQLIPMVPFGTVHYSDVHLGVKGYYAYPVTMYATILGIGGFHVAVSTSPLSGSAPTYNFYTKYIRSEVGL